MQERIAEKDAMIGKLRTRPPPDAQADEASSADNNPLAAELVERDAMTSELSRLREQMLDTQTTMEDAVSTGKALAGQFDDAAAVPDTPEANDAATDSSISVAGSHLDTYRTANSTSGPGGSQREAAAGWLDPASAGTRASAAAAGSVAGDGGGQEGAGMQRRPTQAPQHHTVVGADKSMDGKRAPRSAAEYSEEPAVAESPHAVAEAPRSAKKVMMWKHLAAPAEPPSALLRKASLKGSASTPDDETSERSASTARDSGGTHRSQQSPAAGRGRRHVFQAAPHHVEDCTDSASLQLPMMPDAAREKRSHLDKIFGRTPRC